MELRPLGSSGLMVSPLGLGTTKLGRNEKVKYPQSFELPSDADVRELFATARHAGINLIDTAPAYGTSEARIGALLPDPQSWVVATKVGETFEDGRSSFDFSARAIRDSVARSCRLLRRERLDVVLLHCDDDDVAVLQDGEALRALTDLRREGRIAAVGASTKTVRGGFAAVTLCDVVMLAYNRADRSQRPVIDAAMRAGKGVLIKKPLDSGHDGDPGAALAAIAAEPGIDSAIVGTVNRDHLRANCEAIAAGEERRER